MDCSQIGPMAEGEQANPSNGIGELQPVDIIISCPIYCHSTCALPTAKRSHGCPTDGEVAEKDVARERHIIY